MGNQEHTVKPPLTLSKILSDEFSALHPDAAGVDTFESNLAKEQSENERLNLVFDAIHNLDEKRSLLCLSGGGIRRATFCLGILQGLAKHNLLDKFHYLSTVSGGGYIGSWLTAWIYHERVREEKGTAEIKDNPTQSKIAPEPQQITHLRSYSNLLIPMGFLIWRGLFEIILMMLKLFTNPVCTEGAEVL